MVEIQLIEIGLEHRVKSLVDELIENFNETAKNYDSGHESREPNANLDDLQMSGPATLGDLNRLRDHMNAIRKEINDLENIFSTILHDSNIRKYFDERTDN